MRINNNIMAMNAQRNLTMNTVGQGKALEKLSSGLRINRAADDAAGLSISEKMRGQIRGLQQAQRNAQDGISLIQTAEGAMNEISDMLVRMKELNVQKLNGTYSSGDTANIDEELTKLSESITNIKTDTKFNGTTLLGGGTVDLMLKDTGAVTSYTLADVGTVPTSASALADIETAINTVSTERAKLGAIQNQLEHTVNNVGTTVENLQASESRVRDTDMAQEMMAFTKFNILNQASTAMLAQANQAPQGALQLLR
ncbi:MAG: flagellin [Clostridia bacterium BRH_c25]|nr:MAG: flagellin [Clostridia bacterium BRH_c25]